MISITLIKKKDDNKKQKGRFSDLLGFGMSKILHDETNKRDFFALLYKYLNTCERIYGNNRANQKNYCINL